MENLNELYNKKIIVQKITKENINENDNNNIKIDLCFLTYYGKITMIFDIFNKIDINQAKNIVQNSFTEDKKRNCLQLASFLNFPNIFLYLLTYDADPNYIDENHQNTFHFICYKGNFQILNILLNFISYKIKLKYLNKIENEKIKFGFNNLDIQKGKLSKAVHITKKILKNFNDLQKTIKNECLNMIEEYFNFIRKGLKTKDKEGQNPFHLVSMSKFSLCSKVLNEILDFNFIYLKKENFEEFLKLFFEIQKLEVKKERTNEDPRKIFRLESELIILLGENIIKDLDKKFNTEKKIFFKELINSQDSNGNSILHISSFFGDYRIVKKLLKFGGNKNLSNDFGKFPIDLAKDNFVRKVLTNLNKAANESDQKNINELINFGEDLNEKQSIFNIAPIHKIIESKKENKHEVLKNILILGSDPNLKDSNGWCALHYASFNGDFESVKILLEFNANINNFSNNRKIPLHFACSKNHYEICEFLCENGSDVNFKDENGCSPLHLSAKNGNTKCLEILLKFNANLYDCDFRGWNVLHYSAFHGHKKTVKFIVNYDSDYDILKNGKNSNNKIPIEIVREPEIKKYFCSIFHAAKEGNLDLTKNLLNEGENVNNQTKFELNSPLILATLNANFLEVRLLLEKNADVMLKNKDEFCAVDYAEKMYEIIYDLYMNCKDLDRDKIDLRNVVKKIYNKNNNVDCLICKNNYNERIWKIFDFVEKICKIFGLNVKENKRKNNKKNIKKKNIKYEN